MHKAPTAAIVTTLRDADPVIDSFIKYHLLVGFDHIFLFFDDPEDPSIEKAAKYEAVTTIRNDDSLRRVWEQTRLYAEDMSLRRFIDIEVMARQELNVEVAIRLSLEKNIDWLLHIDIDELFYCKSQTVEEHFKSLSARRVRHISYINYEAIPQRTDTADYFKEIALFKKAPQALNGGAFSETQAELIRSMPELPDSFFLFYGNGKSAARVTEDLPPLGVHAGGVPAPGGNLKS